MTGRIEKTVFISYRRANKPWTLFIYQNLTNHGYDVFIDFQNINSGNFETAILDNIRARAHFVVVLTPSALEDCKNPGDWLRREIETAMDEKHNIVPLMVEGFDFGSPLIKKALTGKLATLSQINGLRLPDDYPFEAMDRLRERYLNIALSDVNLPVLQPEAREIALAEKSAANEEPPVKEAQLTAQTWFERGYTFLVASNFDESIRCYTEAIRLDPRFDFAYVSRGLARSRKGDVNGAFGDYNRAIKLKSRAMYYAFRGNAHLDKRDFKRAMADYHKAINLDPESSNLYYYRCDAYHDKGDLDAALADYTKAIHLDPEDADAYSNRGDVWEAKGNIDGAITDYNEAIRLDPDNGVPYYFRAALWEQKKDYPKAIADYQKCLALGGDKKFNNKKEVEREIKKLKSRLAKKKHVKKKSK
jgi:tetratricopeptide (TPR) repeat protein